MPEINANFVVQPLDITVAVTETNITLEPDPVQLNIFTEGFAPPGGANTEIQYNNSGALDGVPGTSYANNKLTLVNVANLKIPGGSNAFYLQTDGAGNLSFVAGTGNVTGNGTAAGANTQIQFTDGSGNFVSNAGFTFSNVTNTFNAPGDANIVGNVNANNANITNNLVANVVKTDNLQYANGVPYDLTQPGGILHNIQFNDGNGNFGGDNAFIFNPTNNTVGLTGNFTTYNANVTVTLTAANVRTDNLLYANGTPWDFEQPGGSNTYVQFNDNGNLGGTSAFTFNKASNVVDINGNLTVDFLNSFNALLQGSSNITNLTSGNANITNANITIANVSTNLSAGNVKTDNLLYANGTPYDFQQPGGINTNIQFNNANDFGGTNAFVFNQTTNTVGLTGNFNTYNTNVSTQLTAANANVTVELIATNANVTTLLVAANANIIDANVTGNLIANVANITNNLNGNVGNFSGNVIAANVYANSGTVGANLLTGTLTTASQPNITSVGTLTGLDVNGNITAANITANTGIFSGNGAGLTNISGGNVTGQVGNALVAGTVYTAAQPNITSVGNLTSLTVNGNITANRITANMFSGSGACITNVAASAIYVTNSLSNLSSQCYITFVQGNATDNKTLLIDTTSLELEYFPDTGTVKTKIIDTTKIKSNTSSIDFDSANNKIIASDLNISNNKIHLGANAGQTNQGSNSIAIGTNAAPNAQANNSIVINATGSNLFGNTANALFIKPVRTVNSTSGLNALYYDSTTGEIVVYVP